MLVRIDRLRAVMPSGLEIDYPGNTEIPCAGHQAGVPEHERELHGRAGGAPVETARGNTVEPGMQGAVFPPRWGGRGRDARQEAVPGFGADPTR